MISAPMAPVDSHQVVLAARCHTPAPVAQHAVAKHPRNSWLHSCHTARCRGPHPSPNPFPNPNRPGKLSTHRPSRLKLQHSMAP